MREMASFEIIAAEIIAVIHAKPYVYLLYVLQHTIFTSSITLALSVLIHGALRLSRVAHMDVQGYFLKTRFFSSVTTIIMVLGI